MTKLYQKNTPSAVLFAFSVTVLVVNVITGAVLDHEVVVVVLANLAGSYWNEPATLRDLYRRWRLYAAILAISVVFVLGTSEPIRPRAMFEGVTRLSGPWSDPNILGFVTGIALLLTLYGAAKVCASKKKKQTSVYVRHINTFVSTLFCSYFVWVLFRTMSRGALVSLFLSLLIYGYIKIPMNPLDGRGYVNPWLIYLSLPLLVLSIPLALGDSFLVFGRLGNLLDLNDFSWRNRVEGWYGCLKIMADSPHAGVGFPQINRIYASLYSPYNINDPGAVETNSYLHLGAASGVYALILFVLGLVSQIMLSLKNCRSNNQKHGYLGLCLSSYISVFLFTNGGLFNWPIALIVFSILHVGSFGDQESPRYLSRI